MWSHAHRTILILIACLAMPPRVAEAQVSTLERQIRGALLAAPAEWRDSATVLGLGGRDRPGDALTVLRDGSNRLICVADDPEEPGFHVACYHESLDPYMRYGRMARARGLDRAAVMDARYAALERGEFAMPARAALFSASSESETSNLDPDTIRRLTVVYLPGATVASTGLPGRPADGIPWLMLPGTPWAHIMISH